MGSKPVEKPEELGLARGISRTATHTKMTVPSMESGTYYFQNPSAKPNTEDATPSISDLEYAYWTNSVVHKGINLRANRIIGNGFELMPSDHPDANEGIAKEAAARCWQFFQKIGSFPFLRQSIINAYVAGNEWSEAIYNQMEDPSMIHVAHGDFRTIDFRRNFLNNKILLDDKGDPVGYWQYIEDLSQLYHTLSVLYGNLDAYRNVIAQKDRLLQTQSLMIKDENGNEIAMICNKPNFMFLKNKEIIHLSFNNLNDCFYGTSIIIPAWTALTHLQQVMYATAEAINDMGYPKPVVTVGDKDNPPNEKLMNQAEDAIKDPLRKEGFAIPYFMKMEYLQAQVGQNMAEYPTWFINDCAMGLRVPKELLTGEGSANYASAAQNSTDFDKDIEADRRRVEEYLKRIFSMFLNTHGYKQSAGGDSIYMPVIKYPQLVTEDEAKRVDMTLQMWNANLLKFNQAMKLLNLPEEEDNSIGEARQSELAIIQQQKLAPPMPAAPPGNPPAQEPNTAEAQPETGLPEGENQQTVTAQHRLDSNAKLSKWLNKEYKTEDVNYRKVAEESVGKKITIVSEAFAKKIRDTIVNMEAQKKSSADILVAIMKIGDLNEYEARRIMETESQNLGEHGRLQSAMQNDKKYKMWVAHMDKDTSPLCAALNGKKAKIGENFTVKYNENGTWKTWTGDAPAAHPHCRSHLVYSDTARFSKEDEDDVLVAHFGKQKIYLKPGEQPPTGYTATEGDRKGTAILGDGYENVDEKSEDNYTEMGLRWGAENAPKKMRWTCNFNFDQPKRIDLLTMKLEGD